jgi:hypothetical protein
MSFGTKEAYSQLGFLKINNHTVQMSQQNNYLHYYSRTSMTDINALALREYMIYFFLEELGVHDITIKL